MRRDSEPTNPKSKDVKPKLITAAHVTPVAAATSPQSVEKSDKVAYERNVEGLKQELQRSHPRNDAIKTLIRLTFEQRREKINGSTAHTTELLEEFPFFKIKKWVCFPMYKLDAKSRGSLYVWRLNLVKTVLTQGIASLA